MRRSWADDTRAVEVRRAAVSWREAGVIDVATLEAIRAAYPNPRHTLAPAWKVLIFVVVSVATCALFFGVVELTGRGDSPAPWMVFGAILALLTEVLRDSRFSGNGSDAAASFWAVFFLVIGSGLILLSRRTGDSPTVTVVLILACVGFAAACWHWGYATYGALAAAALFAFLGRFPGGRLWWILSAVALIAATAARFDRAALPPPLRRAVAAVFAVSAVALYSACTRYSVDRRLIEELQEDSVAGGTSGALIRLLSTVATVVLPLVFLAWGIRARRTLVLDLGLLFTASSIAMLRYYVHLAPLWVVLTVGGAALILGALWLNRFLRHSPEGEWGGFTASTLFAGRRAGTIQTAAVLAGFQSEPTAAQTGDVSTGGGRFGGGGASGEF
jgi:hypothetical protein